MEQSEKINLVECYVCGGRVPFGPHYYNGIAYDGKLICEGCVLAIGLQRGSVSDEDKKRVEEYKAAKMKEISNRGSCYKFPDNFKISELPPPQSGPKELDLPNE